MQMQNLPQEIQNMIFYYTSSPTAQIIRHLLNVYDDYYDGFTYFNYFFRYQIILNNVNGKNANCKFHIKTQYTYYSQ